MFLLFLKYFLNILPLQNILYSPKHNAGHGKIASHIVTEHHQTARMHTELSCKFSFQPKLATQDSTN